MVASPFFLFLTRLGGPMAPNKAAMCIWLGNNAQGLQFLGLWFGASAGLFRVVSDLSRFLQPLPSRLTFPRDDRE